MYDAATALGEAATLSDRVRETSGSRVLVPEHLRTGDRSVLENYADGADLVVESYPMSDGNVDVAALESVIDDDVVMVYAASPTSRGVLEEHPSSSSSARSVIPIWFCSLTVSIISNTRVAVFTPQGRVRVVIHTDGCAGRRISVARNRAAHRFPARICLADVPYLRSSLCNTVQRRASSGCSSLYTPGRDSVTPYLAP